MEVDPAERLSVLSGLDDRHPGHPVGHLVVGVPGDDGVERTGRK